MLKTRCENRIKREDNETKRGKGTRKLITTIEEFILQRFFFIIISANEISERGNVSLKLHYKLIMKLSKYSKIYSSSWLQLRNYSLVQTIVLSQCMNF